MDNGTTLSRFMHDNDLTDADVAAKMRCSTDAVRAWCKGKRKIRKMTVEALKRAYPAFAKMLKNGDGDEQR